MDKDVCKRYMGVESMKILVCETNGRCIEYVERFDVPDGFKIMEFEDNDEQAKNAIKNGLIFKDGKFIKPEEDKEELLQDIDLEYSEKIKAVETEMARTLAVGDNDLLDELKEEREELVNEYKEKRGELTND